MTQQQRSANALGGRTTRTCDSCIRRRARWFCAADNAFLCQACDSTVHSANSLARRHDRVRLNTASNNSSVIAPAWHHGFTRKPRTPRKPSSAAAPKPAPLVPDLEVELDNAIEEEQLLYRVPIFNPALAEFYSPLPLEDSTSINLFDAETKPGAAPPANSDIVCGFQSSELEMAELENLLGQGFDDEQFCMESLGLMDVREDSDVGLCQLADDECVKMEFAADVKYDYPSPVAKMEEYSDEGLMDGGDASIGVENESVSGFKLRLDYDAVASAWGGGGCSPWIDGQRPPQLSLDVFWPDYTGMFGEVSHMAAATVDEGREARVMRYREKRRTRLFSKKIRYEVRKLNAEKRPRMKGRFVKRSSAAAAGSFPY
uniref:CONSTANS-like 6 protein n=1 Tax=Lilium formosanum x Lilium longiflorum TaxID=375287 RepID=A0A2Z4C0R2_9LILI|nr:CONSTANS-like 6 protein [Lilium formosanum x Lilium longiflorum]